MKSLLDIAKNNELPIKVIANTETVYILIALGKNNDAYTHTEKGPKNLIMRTADEKKWAVWTEPKPVPHWPAVRTNGNRYEVSSTLYPNEEKARDGIGARFVRLCTDYPAVKLVPKA